MEIQISENQKIRNAGFPQVREYWNPGSQLSGLPEIRISDCPDILKIRKSGLFEHPDIWFSGNPDFPMSGSPGILISQNSKIGFRRNVGLPYIRYSVNLEFRLSGFLRIWLSVSPDVQKSVYPEIRISGFSHIRKSEFIWSLYMGLGGSHVETSTFALEPRKEHSQSSGSVAKPGFRHRSLGGAHEFLKVWINSKHYGGMWSLTIEISNPYIYIYFGFITPTLSNFYWKFFRLSVTCSDNCMWCPIIGISYIFQTHHIYHTDF